MRAGTGDTVGDAPGNGTSSSEYIWSAVVPNY